MLTTLFALWIICGVIMAGVIADRCLQMKGKSAPRNPRLVQELIKTEGGPKTVGTWILLIITVLCLGPLMLGSEFHSAYVEIREDIYQQTHPEKL
jgi:hypothetical protein